MGDGVRVGDEVRVGDGVSETERENCKDSVSIQLSGHSKYKTDQYRDRASVLVVIPPTSL